MSKLYFANDIELYVLDFDVLIGTDGYPNGEFGNYYKGITKCEGTWFNILFPEPAIGQKQYLTNGNYFEVSAIITSVSDHITYTLQGKKSDGTLLNSFTAINVRNPATYSGETYFLWNRSAKQFYCGEWGKRQTVSSPSTQESPTAGKYCYKAYNTVDPYPQYRMIPMHGINEAQQNNFLQLIDGSFSEKVYFPGQTTDNGGGGGTFDNTGNNIGFGGLPTLSAVAAGFITIYNPSLTSLQALSDYLWTSNFFDNVKKIFSNPMDAIIGLSIVPVIIPPDQSVEVKVSGISTGVYMTKASSQYTQLNCGTLAIEEYWGSALDYSPYTKIQIYLPYIGIRELSTDDIMGKTIELLYNVDILTGACTAQIKSGNSVLYQFSGSCSCSIPITGRDFSQIISNVVNAVGGVALGVATGGLAAPMTVAGVAAALNCSASSVMNSKPRVERSGSMGSTAGLMGVQTPYLIIERPRQALPVSYNEFVGYPSNITAMLSTLSGYTEVESIHLENIHATSDELTEIENLLKGGILL